MISYIFDAASVSVDERAAPSFWMASVPSPETATVTASSDAASGRVVASATGRAKGRGGDKPAVPTASGPVAARVEAALREWRRERSRADGVPAYVVINDRHLMGIAERRPTTTKGLAACPGIGPAKLAAYGDELIALVTGSVGAEREE